MEKKQLPILMCSLFLLSSCYKLSTDINNYTEYLNKLEKADTFMPKIDSLSNYRKIDVFFMYNYDDMLVGPYGSINLKLSYSDEHYEEEKTKVLNNYQFLTSPIKESSTSKYYVIPEVSFDYREYHIQVVDDSNYDYDHYFGMIGYSDSLKEICYLYYYSYDYVNIERAIGGMKKLLDKYFCFRNEDR